MRSLLLLVLCVASLAAQQVTIRNNSAHAFEGWVRRNVSPKPPLESGLVSDVHFVVGQKAGLDTWHVDLYVALAPGGVISASLADAVAYPKPDMTLPGLSHFGGWLTVGGEPMGLLDFRADGAAFTAHCLHRKGMFATHVWLRWYPSEPVLVHFEAATVCSNPALPDMIASPGDTEIKFGDGFTFIVGKQGADLAKFPFADGQARVVKGFFAWPKFITKHYQFAAASAQVELGMGAIAVERLWATGRAQLPGDFDARDWMLSKWRETQRRMHTWDAPLVGPNLNSADTGAQEEQMFHPGHEAYLFPGAEWISLLNALKLHGERPCNHLEADGTGLDLEKHPGLLMWDARPHFGISADKLGKPRGLSPSEAYGRWGPDTQHFLARRLGVSARITASPAANWLLSRLATAYLAMRTATPGWSPSGTFSAREWGYEGEFVVQCHRELEDRVLAAKVVSRWRERVRRILIPEMEGRDYIFKFTDDERLGPGDWVIGWQESFGSWGIELACTEVGPSEGRAVALRVAKAVLARGWAKVDGVWVCRAQYPLAGDPGPADGSFNDFGMPLCAEVVRRHKPTHPKANAVLDALAAAGAYKWVAPR